MVVRPHTSGIPLRHVRREPPYGHVSVLPTTVYFNMRILTAFRMESGSIVKNV
jgi:hypothetical protein